MALAPLASTTDLTVYGVTLDGVRTDQVDRYLATASAVIRQAAGSPISEVTSTLTVTVTGGEYVHLPGPPVTWVETVSVDGTPVSDWRLVGDTLWRPGGWAAGTPVDVTVTYVHGLTQVPEDIVSQVVVMVAGALSAARASDDGSGLAPDLGVASYAIDDYRETAVDPADRLTSPFDLPKQVRASLRARFGGGAAVVGAGR